MILERCINCKAKLTKANNSAYKGGCNGCNSWYYFDGSIIEADIPFTFKNRTYQVIINADNFQICNDDWNQEVLLHLDYIPENIITDFHNIVEKYLKLQVFI